MLWAADVYQQRLDPLAGLVPGSAVVSTILAALPVVVLFWLLVPARWSAPKAGLGATVVALLVAVFVYGMPVVPAGMSFLYGVCFGLLPVGWTIFNAMLLYNITVRTGKFDVVRRSIAGLSGDARVQAVLIAFAFGAFLEGAAGGGTPVAICGAIMVGLGFNPFLAAVLCLIANTSPVAYGGLGTPLFTLQGVTSGLPVEAMSVMAGHQLPFLSLFVPLYMVRCMCDWKKTFEVWPVLLVSGLSFAVFQFFFATSHVWVPGLVLFPMTDIGGGIFTLVVTAVFLRFWKPKKEWHFDKTETPAPVPEAPISSVGGHAAEAEAAKHLLDAPPSATNEPLTPWSVAVAWTPFAMMSVFLMLTGLVRQNEPSRPEKPPVMIGPIQTNYLVPVPFLHEQTERDPYLTPEGKKPEKERALYNFAWLTSPGTAVFFAVIASVVMLRMSPGEVWEVLGKTVVQMKIPIPTIAFMLGLSYVTRFSGMDATLGLAFAGTGLLYPFFAPMLGWLGVFLTGTDAGSNALFGSLQQITATQVHNNGAMAGLDLSQAQLLICTSNSTGGVMGKMIDAQSIVVATAATNQIGREADIFKAVVWHSVFLACIVGIMTLLQAYVAPFTWLVPVVRP